MRKQSSTNFKNELSITTDCPIASALKVIGGRWKLMILWNLRDGARRYKELQRAIPGITEKMLSQQLTTLVEDGWIVRKDYGEIPPRTDYGLTELGHSFTPVLQHIYDWGLSNDIIARVNKKLIGERKKG